MFRKEDNTKETITECVATKYGLAANKLQSAEHRYHQ